MRIEGGLSAKRKKKKKKKKKPKGRKRLLHNLDRRHDYSLMCG
jgi:hypothetical protein